MTSLLLKILMYVSIGIIEWKIAGRRFSAQMDFEMYMGPILVVVEGLLAWFVIDQFMTTHDIVIIISTSIGGGIGLYIEMLRRKAAKETESKKKNQILP